MQTKEKRFEFAFPKFGVMQFNPFLEHLWSLQPLIAAVHITYFRFQVVISME